MFYNKFLKVTCVRLLKLSVKYNPKPWPPDRIAGYATVIIFRLYLKVFFLLQFVEEPSELADTTRWRETVDNMTSSLCDVTSANNTHIKRRLQVVR